MRILAGLVLGFMAILTAGHWLPTNHNREQLVIATAIATQGIARPEHDASHLHSDWGRTFSPRTPLLIVPPPATPKAAPAITPVTATNPVTSTAAWATQIFTTASAVAAQATAPAIRTQSVSAAKVIVTGAVHTTGASEPSSAVPATTVQPKNEDDVYDLARKLQNELKRVGCYSGEIDGDWGPASKRGMALFTARVNATLPVETPDYILLTLVKGHAQGACGNGCPAGHLEDDKGRCLPRAVVAQATRMTPETQRRAPASQAPALASERHARAAQPVVVTHKSAVVASAASAMQRASSPSTPVWSASTAPRPALPGRMSVGAPLPEAHPAPRPSVAPSAAAIISASITPAATAEVETRRPKSNRRAKSSASTRRATGTTRARQTYAFRTPSRPSPSPRRARRSSSWTATFFDRAGATY